MVNDLLLLKEHIIKLGDSKIVEYILLTTIILKEKTSLIKQIYSRCSESEFTSLCLR